MKIEATPAVYYPKSENSYQVVIMESWLGEITVLAKYYHKWNELEIRANHARHYGRIIEAFASRHGHDLLNRVKITWY